MLRVLDLFCGAGGASTGLEMAGFDVYGVDINPQPNYPFDFVQADALIVCLDGFDFIWASPPCQAYSVATKRWYGYDSEHPDLIAQVRDRLNSTDTPYIIENVPSAPLRKDVTLCGFMFGLATIRHRIFESNIDLIQPDHVRHTGIRGRDYFTVAGHPGGYSIRDGVYIGSIEQWREAMQIDWMNTKELTESIPPAYSAYLGRQVMEHLNET